ncbi:ankyrin repeat domain-containing protein [Byssothecium circinans]|uniref:Ankyrin repeat domain-containing protein n=1 Tax=Byssothecium circinans TaxID=147558 RepID=A0A6A5TIW8_9PLEO|nr:ankyrin repeat domain-containing protein [Byssothecium circinans]
MLDEEHENAIREVGDNDENVYCMGSVAGHNVVIVCLPAGHIGTNPAAAVATQMRTAFKGIRFGLMVGIGGGVPSAEADIRLGDVVVSQPQWNFGGVVQYDFGRTTPNGLERVGSLNSPPQILLSAVSTVQANAIMRKSTLSEHLSTLERIPTFQRLRAGPDVLFEAAYNHEHGATCDQCSVESRQPRPERESGAEVTVHYGTIASGNQVMKDAAERDRWQSHAAGTAAAYAKELLSVIPAAEVMNTRRAEDAMNGASSQQSLLDSLRFERINDRQMTIKSAHAKTCRWLLKSEHYLNWLDTTKIGEHHGFLWIKGKAGTGKSTLMKFALVNAHKTMKGCTVLSFFFNARGEDIEKSTIGTYRSLLLQLLERLPALQSVFDSLSLSTSSFSTVRQWNVESLKTLLEQAMQRLGNSSVVRDMIQFFEHIGDLAVSNGIRFQVCFSSRHYPHITIRNGLELVLEGQEGHSQDITNYVETELKIGKSKIAQRVRAELQEKASGIFLWVVLVVSILNKESDRGKIHTLRQKLQEIPGDLHELFRDILTRDSHDKDKLVLCIQWVLFAKQPLSPEQLYHAIYAGTDPGADTEWDPEDITKDVIKLFILSSLKGLAEITVSKEPKAQFIHESVRDFLLKENGLGKIWPEFRSNFQGQSHERLKQCCLNYISVDVATPLRIPDDLPKASSQQAASLRNLATKTFPFLEYAVRNMLYHADTAEGGGISQADFLDSFPLPRWVKLDNLFKKHEVRRHKDNSKNLLLNAAELGHDGVLTLKGKDNQSLLYIAAEQGNKAVVALLLDKGADVNAQGGDSGNALQAALAGGHKETATLLLDKGANVNAQDKGADVNAQGGAYGNALQAALAGGHKEMATLLQK